MTTTTTTTTTIYDLPVEILLHILRLSTSVPSRYRYRRGDPTYRPFFNTRYRRDNPPPLEKEIWSTKLTLPLVCRSWRELALGITYEEIYVGEHAGSLLSALAHSEHTFKGNGNGFGKHVRSLVLSCWRLGVGVPQSVISDIMRWCPNVDYLVKDDIDISPAPCEGIDLGSVKRFDWVFIRFPHPRLADLTHGRDFYREVVRRAENLEYLHVAISYPSSRVSRVEEECRISARSLTTLNVQHIRSILRTELEGWHLPKLRNIITDSSLTWDTLSPLFGPQIEVVEFLKDEALYDTALGVLERCPNLRELCYFVEFSRMPRSVAGHERLECVRLHSGRNYMLVMPDVRMTVERQFMAFAGGGFPALKRVVLYGDWEVCFLDEGFRMLCERLRRRKCEVEDEFGRPMPAVRTLR